MLKVLIADDDPIVRRGIKKILAEDNEFVEYGEASNSREILEKAQENEWNLIIMEITISGIERLDILKDVKREHPKLPVLILSFHPEDHYAVRTIRAGAAGYLTKKSALEDLIIAVKKVSNGGKYISATLAEKLAIHLKRNAPRYPHEKLSDREYQVLCMIISGVTIKKIAEILSLSVKTIRTYKTRMLEKMKMMSDADILLYAIQNRLI